MKPVPFAEFLARRQQSAASAALAPIAGFELAAKAAGSRCGGESRALSPLLPQDEAEKPEPAGLDLRSASSRLICMAFEEGREAARRELEDERDRMRDALAAEVAQERTKWAEEEGARAGGRASRRFRGFRDALRPGGRQYPAALLDPAGDCRVTEALVENLEALFASRTRALFEISGPADLLDALREKFADRRRARSPSNPRRRSTCACASTTPSSRPSSAAWLSALGALPQGAQARERKTGMSEDKPPEIIIVRRRVEARKRITAAPGKSPMPISSRR